MGEVPIIAEAPENSKAMGEKALRPDPAGRVLSAVSDDPRSLLGLEEKRRRADPIGSATPSGR